MTLGYITRETLIDTRKLGDFNDNPLLRGKGASFNTNFYAIIDIVDEADQGTVLETFAAWADDLTDPRIDQAARDRIESYLRRNAAKSEVTVGVFKIPAAIDPKVLASQQKQAEYQAALTVLVKLKQQQALGLSVSDQELSEAVAVADTAKVVIIQ